MTARKETAAEAYTRQHAEFTRRVKLLADAVEAGNILPAGTKAHWGHVGSLAHINEVLTQALHHAGVAGFTEE